MAGSPLCVGHKTFNASRGPRDRHSMVKRFACCHRARSKSNRQIQKAEFACQFADSHYRDCKKSVSEAVSNYRKSDLPLSMKIALPATLAAVPLVGGQAAGIAAFGGAFGVPVLSLVFLGTAGITSIIETIVTDPEARPHC